MTVSSSSNGARCAVSPGERRGWTPEGETVMEDTQAVNWEAEEEEETERPSDSLGCSLEPLGRLHVFSSAHGPEKDFPLYLGKNVVGRMPDCSVALPFPSISKQHAVIEILAWDKAPVLWDCGSLNGTQILRPPKFLSPGVSHRLRDQELVVFADLPCQYHRLDVSLPFVSRGPLTVEETPRVQGGTQPWGILLAEDSEEEVDPLSERYVANEPRTMSSLLATVVPESDEEGPSSAPDGPGPPSAFNLDSDTDEEESQQPAAGWASSAATRDATAETEQPEAVRTEIQVEKDPSLGQERNSDIRVKRDASNGVILERSQPPGEDSETDVEDESRPPGKPAEGHLERAQPSGFIDSDTDVEEEAIPTTPAVVPMKRRQIFHGVNAESPGGPDLAHLHESPAGSETDVEEAEAPLTVPLERSQASMVSNSNVDDEEGVSAALTLVHLKESRATAWNRDTDVEEDRAQPPAFLEQSQTSTGRDSDTDMEVEGFPVEKRGYVPKSHTDKAQPEKSPPPFGDSDREVEEEKSSPGVLERSQASATVGINTPLEEEVSPGPAVTLPGKHEVPVAGTNPTNVEAEGGPAKLPAVHLEEAQPPPVAGVRKSQLPAEGDAGTEWVVPVLQPERALEAAAQGGSPLAQVEQDHLLVSRENLTDLLVDTGTAGEPTQAQRKGAQPPRESGGEPHVDMTKNCGHSHDDYPPHEISMPPGGDSTEKDQMVPKPEEEVAQKENVSQKKVRKQKHSEDLDQQATQCFVERENQSPEAVPRMEDEPTQAFLFTPPQEPGPSHCSFQASGGLDEPWEVLATQPFCLRESEASETQPIATHLEAHGSCPLSPRPTPQDQHLENPFHAEPLGIQGGGLQTSEKGIGTPREAAERVTPKREPLERETKKLPPAGSREDVMGEEELTRVMKDREQKQVLARDTRRQESNKTGKCKYGKGYREFEGPLNCKMSPAEKASRGDPGSLDVCLPPAVPEASAPVQNSLIPQSQKHLASQPLFAPSPPLESPIPSSRQNGSQEALENPLSSELDPLHAKSKCRPQGCSRMTPSPASIAPELHPATSREQPVPPEPTSRATRGRTHRASVRTPEPTVPTDQPVPPELTSQATRGRTHRASVRTPEPTVPTDQPVPPELTSQATRGRTHRASVRTPEPTVPTDQPVPPELTSQATRGRTHRASVRTPEPTVPTDQPVPPELTSQATRGRTHRASVKTPEPTVPTDQPVPPEPTSQATRGRTHRASVKTPDPTVPTDQPVPPELTSQATRGRTHRASVKTPDPTVPTDQPVPPELTSQATRGRTHRASVKTPEPTVPTAPDLEPLTSTDQPVTPEPTSRATRSRTHRASVKTPEPTVPTDQPVPPEPTSQATRGRTHRASVRTPEPTVPTAPDLEPPTPTDQPVTPKAIAQGGRSRTLRSTRSAVPVPTTPESQSPFPTDQPIPPEPIPQANCSRRPRVARQPLAVPIVYEPCSAPLEPNAWSSRSQRRGAVRATKSLRTIPEPAFAQLPGAPTHALQIQKIEATGGYEFSPGSPPKAFQNHKKPSDTVDSPPLPKRLRREVPQKTVVLKEEEEEKPGKEEDVVMPGPGKRKRDQAEEEPKGMPVRSLRQTKPSHESAAPKVLFTGVVDARGEQAVLALGGSLASSVAEASHLVTDRICRTVKFLCALGRGIPILSLDWLYQSRKAGCFLPPDDYVVTDPEQEKNFGFSLRDSLSRARERRLLEGYEIHVTPGVQPPPPQMGEIISCCGGTVLPSMPRSYKPQRVVITCSQDAPRCTTPFRVGLPILSPEFLLTGVLKQEAKPEAFVLSTLEMASP
ncbi:Mediator of DNA damage checkpoint protein 1 [Myotis brandtii]|uniref:Mediator of DNA damage checkpoint protein 1 n=1 Tax=Myotis brandtii TaxID=109478 RepID=S7PDC8_MYOBR|nr:Mediator of DNA damage checkpoint protein 1 [Myotis brandtii]